jgi:biopolymer transport protein ExbB
MADAPRNAIPRYGRLEICATRQARFARLGFLLALPLAFSVRSQDLEGVASGAASDLQKALAELSAVRQEVETERLPLARKLAELEQKLADRRAELAKAQRFQENQLVELNALKGEAKLRSDEVKYIDSLLSEYARSFRSRLNFIEEPRYQTILNSVEKAAAAPDLSPAERFSQRSVLLTTALKRGESALGGELFEGKALDKQGRVQPGKVALIGPVAMFASSSGDVAGLLQQELNRADPTVIPLDKKLDEACRALVATGQGELALDPTLGNAFKLAALKESLYEKLAAGGPVMIPLLGLGVAALLVGFFKWHQFSRIRLATELDLQRVLRHLKKGERDAALAHAQSIAGPAGDLLATAVEHADEKKEYIEEIVYEKMLGARTRLERGISFLALTATTGPLLGLLGTVTGMIATFKLISSFGSGDPKMLAAGISEALVATATGMGVAIPALLLHAFLSRKAKGIIGSMEQTAVGFINGVPKEEKTTFA